MSQDLPHQFRVISNGASNLERQAAIMRGDVQRTVEAIRALGPAIDSLQSVFKMGSWRTLCNGQ